MKRIPAYAYLLFFIGLVFFDCAPPNDFPVLKGPYLGQKPPGKTPELFAPSIISTEKRELNSVFSRFFEGEADIYWVDADMIEEMKPGILK